MMHAGYPNPEWREAGGPVGNSVRLRQFNYKLGFRHHQTEAANSRDNTHPSSLLHGGSGIDT